MEAPEHQETALDSGRTIGYEPDYKSLGVTATNPCPIRSGARPAADIGGMDKDQTFVAMHRVQLPGPLLDPGIVNNL